MNSTIISIITYIITASPIAYGLIKWKDLPDQIAIHFGLNGQPNGFAPKIVPVLVIPASMILCQFIMLYTMKKANVSITSMPFVFTVFIIPIVSIVTAISIYGYAFK